MAGGFEMARAGVLLVAANDAKFGLSEVRRGLVANGGALLRLPRLLPAKIAAELVLTGDIYPASLLTQHGLINLSKQVLTESEDWSTTDMLDRQFELTAPVFTSADAK